MRGIIDPAAVALGFFLAPASASAVTPPNADSFYTPPPGFSAAPPGTVFRARPVALQELSNSDSAGAYQLLYRTTSATGQPIATVTTLLLPSLPASGPRKLLSYQTAEDSLTTNCAPSYTMRGGNNGGSTQWAESGEITQALLQGWDVVVPDYQGPQSEWAVGPIEGQATLDSVRAVEHFSAAQLPGTHTAVAMVGYSGGSIPTLWASTQAHRYAPELNLVGSASGGNVPDLIENLARVNGGPFAGAIIGVSVAINRAYPDLGLDALLNAGGRQLAARDGSDADGCAGSVTNAPFGTVGEYTNYATAQELAALPQVRRVFARLDLIGGPLPAAPAFIYNEANDELAITPPVDKMVASYCARGATIDYDRNPAGEHLT
ncbi:MAG TPA: lipase family protein, partial [Solirubrobacteraceae bacterium]|nr:lipase family protein [Solirubrobacteraceae bacterium]